MKSMCPICNRNEFDGNDGKAKAIMCDECWDKYIVPRASEQLSSGSTEEKIVTKQCVFCGKQLILTVADSWKTMHPDCWNEHQNQQNPDDTRPKNENGEPLCLTCGKPLDKKYHASESKWIVRHKECHDAHKANNGARK